MAGIGFELRRLTRRDDLLGIVQGMGHSALASTGPWLFTIVSLGGAVLIGSHLASPDVAANFQLIVIYNFAFSLVLSAPVMMVATRVLADSIYEKDVRDAPALLLASLVFLYAVQVLVAGPFYLFHVDLPWHARLAAISNFFLVTGIWVVSIFLTALKDYNSITVAFGCGVTVSLASCACLAPRYAVTGMLAGFNSGMVLIFFLLAARVFAEYPYPVRVVSRFRAAHRNALAKYWELALGGFVYGAAIWIDKWIMWFAPERRVLASGMFSYPDYDSGMFLAYFSIIPAMSAFVLSVETEFFEKYLRFYRHIQRHATLGQIRGSQGEIIETLLAGVRNFVVLQGSICLAGILLAPQIFEFFRISFSQLGIFRFGLLGAFFHVLFLFISIVLSYFDLKRVTLALQVVFLVSNGLFTLGSLSLGYPWYGHGYFMACLVSFAAALIAVARCVGRLPYIAFIRTNTSAR
jgi:uncharacterized membrane protein